MNELNACDISTTLDLLYMYILQVPNAIISTRVVTTYAKYNIWLHYMHSSPFIPEENDSVKIV